MATNILSPTYQSTDWVDGNTIVNAENLDNIESGIVTNRAYCNWLASWSKQRPSESFSTPWLCVPYISLFSPRDHDVPGPDTGRYDHGKYGEVVQITDFSGGNNQSYRFAFRCTFTAEQIRANTDYSVTLETYYHPGDGISKVNDEDPHFGFLFAKQFTSSGASNVPWPAEQSWHDAKRVDGFDYYLTAGGNQIRGPWHQYMRYRFVITGGV